MLPSSPLEAAAHKIQLTVSILTSCNFLLLLVSFGFNSQISILVQLLRFPQAFINVGIIAFASLKTPLSNPRVTAAAAASRAGASSSHRGRSRSRRRRYIVLSCCSACLILVLVVLASLILPSAAKTGSPLFLILGTLNILAASFLLADAVLLDMHRRREKKSGPAGTSSSSTSSSSSSSSVSNTDQQPQLPQFHVYQPRLSLTSDRVVVQEDGGDTELEPLPKYQPQEPEQHAPTIIIDLANLEPGQHHQQQHQQQQQLAVGRTTSSVELGGSINSSSSSGSRSSGSSSRGRGHGPLTMGRAESDSRRTSWEDVETGIVPDYSQATTAGGQTAAERSTSVLLPSTAPTTATGSTSDDHDHDHVQHHDSGTPPTGSATSPNTSAAAEGAAEDVTESAATAAVLTSIPTSAPPVYAP